jgi:EAL domain-containing protein (putative c-di-GMP-specific phosphodiesterase class I)
MCNSNLRLVSTLESEPVQRVEPIQQRDYHQSSFGNYLLKSAFQPIISIPHRRAVGYEGLVRAYEQTTDELVSPFSLFATPKNSSEFLSLDRICRSLHAHNFSKQSRGNEWLFLNLDLQCLANEQPHPGFMTSLFKQTGLDPSRVVIEILESRVHDRDYLNYIVNHFKQLGCLIAIDDFGAGHSNFDRIWELEPDIVKLDRNLINRAARSAKVKRIFSGMVSLIHGTGSLVLVEGVETREEALVTIEVNADLVQGYYFAHPKQDILEQSEFDGTLTELLQVQKQNWLMQTTALDEHFSRFHKYYSKALSAFQQGQSFKDSVELVFKEPKAVRCYLLDEAGLQIGKTIKSPHHELNRIDRYKPLLSGDKANWSQKHYHYRAIHHPGKLQISRPYLSLTGGHLCITVSKAVEIDQKLYVYCCDLDWQDE